MLNDKDIKNILGIAIKDLRVKKGITQEKLAEFLGLQTQTITKIETGKRFVSAKVFANLCNFFNIEPYALLTKQGQTYSNKDLEHISQINYTLKEMNNALSDIKNKIK